MRNLYILGAIWKYEIGKQNVVIIDPDHKKTVVPLSLITGTDQNTIITPKQMREFIMNGGTNKA